MLVASSDLSVLRLQACTALTNSGIEKEDIYVSATLWTCCLSAADVASPSFSYIHLGSNSFAVDLSAYSRTLHTYVVPFYVLSSFSCTSSVRHETNPKI